MLKYLSTLMINTNTSENWQKKNQLSTNLFVALRTANHVKSNNTQLQMDEDTLSSELQLLSSMYSSEDISFDDPEIALKLEAGLPIAGSVSFSLRINDDLELHLRIPEGYPSSEKLSASCRIVKPSSNSQEESELNSQLMKWIRDNENEASKNIMGLVNLLNETWGDKLLEKVNEAEDENCSAKKFCRIWIHSHHIYNEKKRKFILDTAGNLDLKGFSLPGKPGFICVEGDEENCDHFWTQVRQLTWQKINLIEKKLLKNEEEKVFAKFEELLLDKSSFMKYLNERNVSSVIKDYLGF